MSQSVPLRPCTMRTLKILNKPLLQVKKCWSIFKTFYNEKKISVIPPLLIGKKFVTNIEKKANNFNNFFVEECTQSLRFFNGDFAEA